MAWRAVEGSGSPHDAGPVAELFAKLLVTTREALGVESDVQARQMIYLVAIAALGHGLAGNVLAELLGMDGEEMAAFPEWMNAKLI